MDCFKIGMRIVSYWDWDGRYLTRKLYSYMYMFWCVCSFLSFPGLLKIGLRTAFAHISQLVEQYYECIQG